MTQHGGSTLVNAALRTFKTFRTDAEADQSTSPRVHGPPPDPRHASLCDGGRRRTGAVSLANQCLGEQELIHCVREANSGRDGHWMRPRTPGQPIDVSGTATATLPTMGGMRRWSGYTKAEPNLTVCKGQYWLSWAVAGDGHWEKSWMGQPYASGRIVQSQVSSRSLHRRLVQPLHWRRHQAGLRRRQEGHVLLV